MQRLPAANALFTDERLLLQVLPGLRPCTWQGLRRLSRGMLLAITAHLLNCSTSQFSLLPAGENVCKLLEMFADGATVVLAPGWHRWAGKLYAKGISIFGLPGTRVRGRVQLAEGFSGSFFDVSFHSGDGGNVRLQDASWAFHGCILECSDTDASAMTVASSNLAMDRCKVRGVETGFLVKPCWIGLLAKGKSNLSLHRCHIGPFVQRAIVAIDDATLSLVGGCIEGCEEIGLRLNGQAHVDAKGTKLMCGGMALYVGSACNGSLELQRCQIESFRTLWGGDFRPPRLDMGTTEVKGIGGGGAFEKDSNCFDRRDAERAI